MLCNNADRAESLMETLSNPVRFELLGFETVEDWEELLNEAHKAQLLAIKNKEVPHKW